MKNLIGCVLCGGQSIRMGTDKGLISVEDTPWAKLSANKMEELNIPVVFSVNQNQLSNYKALFPTEQCITDHNINVEGPLKGLLSIHQEYPTLDILMMACDMIDMDKLTLSHLINIYQTEPNHDYYVYKHQDLIEPFCGIYTSGVLKNVMESIDNESFQDFSFQHILAIGNTKTIIITDNAPFKNYNKVSDIGY